MNRASADYSATAGTDTEAKRIEDEALEWLLEANGASEDSGLQSALADWRQQSPRHEEAYVRVERVWRLAGELPWEATTEHRSRKRASVRAPQSRRRIVFAAAAALAATVAIFLAPVVALNLSADHVTGVGEVRQIVLSDGSIAELDAESALTVDYSDDGRRLRLLSGRAFFQVQNDPERPFKVVTEDLVATVTGTAFAVALGRSGGQVTVAEGSVKVGSLSADGVAPTDRYTLMPGDRLAVSAADGQVVRSRIATENVAAWRDNLLIADAMALSTVVEQLRRYHRGVIVLRSPALSTAQVTGVFNLNDPLAALQAAAATQGARVTALTPYVLLVDRP
ncbi:FecR family protein [Pelagibius sp.]|uniref:FecR family protein n=1 Tax=Pelagibius sp. TaxID=1931238 RepID=UPI003BAEA0C8